MLVNLPQDGAKRPPITVDLVPADEDPLRRLIRWLVPLRKWWLTYRLPGQTVATVTHPAGMTTKEAKRADTLQHERVHAEDFARPWAPLWILALVLLFPLPVLFSGRWFVERHAYLHDIRRGADTVEGAVHTLWSGYGWCWPKPLMRRWFHVKLRPHVVEIRPER